MPPLTAIRPEWRIALKYVPFRAVGELLGSASKYDDATCTIIASEGEINAYKCVEDYNNLVKQETFVTVPPPVRGTHLHKSGKKVSVILN